MPLQATSGAASYDAFGGGVPVVPTYIEDVFSTWLYDGNSSTNNIVNGIDLSDKGGLTWIKSRNTAVNHALFDTARGDFILQSNNTQGQFSGPYITYNSNGFSLGNESQTNNTGRTYASWTFRKQPKFFDVVTYTGNGGTQQNIAHNLQASPGCIIVKRTDVAGNWYVAPIMQSNWNNDYILLNSSAAKVASSDIWQGTSGTSSTTFGVQDGSTVNISGATYVAYLFAHDAGGFGLTGTDNVISCGSFTTDTNGDATVNLGYEPQWLTFKSSDLVQDWYTLDTMRGFTAIPAASAQTLRPNTSAAESNYWSGVLSVNSTGFQVIGTSASKTYIYIAIRRGPMKVPTSGTSVFNTSFFQSSAPRYRDTFPVDLGIYRNSRTEVQDNWFASRLTGATRLNATDTAAEGAEGDNAFDYMTGFNKGIGSANTDKLSWIFKRAPSFFDEVCYVGNDDANTQTHNLKVKPELVISKSRSAATNGSWGIWSAGNGVVNNDISGLTLNSNAAAAYPNFGNSSKFTATTFGADWVLDADGNNKNQTGVTYVTYLFATCAGVSKVFSYTGNGSSKTIDCGFTGGARFVLIKRTNSTGDWYVWDTARNIVSGNDPHLSLNSTAAEVTTDDTIDTDTTGFIVNQVSATNVNVTDATYIGLAIA